MVSASAFRSRWSGLAFLTAFPDGHHVFEQVVVEGDNVMTLGTYEGTHRGEMRGIAPTNPSDTSAPIHAPLSVRHTTQ